MRRRFGTVGAIVVFEAAVFLAGAPEAAAQQAAASFAWYGELVGADAAARTITARAQVLPHVALYAPSFKPGEKVVLVWEPVKEESDRLLFIAREDAMKGVEVGYIVRAEMVSADAAARTVTFRARMSDTAFSGISSVAPGQWIRVTMPRVQSNGAEMLTTTVVSDKPKLPPRPAPSSGAMPAAGAPAAPTPAGGGSAAAVAATWVVKAELAGNELSNECTFAVEGTKLGGSCKGPLGASSVTGLVSGNTVRFSFSVDVQGNSLDLAHTGTVSPDGKTIKGEMEAFGTSASFEAVRK